jgi:hypothetical protein
VGKTQTVLEYTYRKRDCFQCIFWLRAETGPELLKTYFVIGRKVGLFSESGGIDQNKIEAVRDWLEKTGELESSRLLNLGSQLFESP